MIKKLTILTMIVAVIGMTGMADNRNNKNKNKRRSPKIVYVEDEPKKEYVMTMPSISMETLVPTASTRRSTSTAARLTLAIL